jgi:hypothetical protein
MAVGFLSALPPIATIDANFERPRGSAKVRELQLLRDKYGKARAFTVEGLPK